MSHKYDCPRTIECIAHTYICSQKIGLAPLPRPSLYCTYVKDIN